MYNLLLPLFLGIFVSDQDNDSILVKLHIWDATKYLLQQLPNKLELQFLRYDLQNTNYYQRPASLHITSFYIGDDPTAEQSEYYKKFTKDVAQQMKCHAIAICPKKIITCIMKREEYAVPIQNQYPHMTLLLGSWTAVDSNTLMESLFNINKPLHAIYESLFQDSDTDQYWETHINALGEQNIPTYVMKFSNKMVFKGQTDYGYD